MRILIVDDERAVARAVARMLRGHETTMTHSVAEAQEAIERGEFDLILSDVMLNGATGADLHRWVLEHQPELASRMVFLTGGMTVHVAKDIEATGNQLLWKPVKADTMRAVVGGFQ